MICNKPIASAPPRLQKMTNLPTDLRSFWSFRDELGIGDGVLFKGKQVMIPERMRDTILSQLHKGHQGIEKTRMKIGVLAMNQR